MRCTTLSPPSGAGGGVSRAKASHRQNDGDEGDRNVEVLSHQVRLLVTEIKRNKRL